MQNGILVAKYTYDAAGNLRTKSVPAPRGDKFDVSLYEYDEYNRLIKTTETGTRGTGLIETTYAYYGDGLVREVTDTLDQSTEYLYDQRRQLTELKQTLDGVMSSSGSELSGVQTVSYYHYDAAGNLQSEASGLQNQMTTYTYDRDGRVIRKMLPDPDAGASLPALYVSYKYDTEGNQISESLPRPKNQIASAPTGHNFYDEAGRLIRSEGPAVTATVNGSQTLSATFTAYEYYADGAVKTVRDGFAVSPGTTEPEDTGLRDDDVVRTWTTTVYDKLGRIKNTTTGGLGIIEATTSVEYLKPSDNPSPPINDTLAVSWEKTTAPPIDGLPCVTWSYYDQYGRLIRTVLPDPDGSGTLPITSICYSYNADGTVAEQWQEAGTDTTHRNWTKFSYDAVGQLIHKRDAKGTVAGYRYDALGRVELELTAGGMQLVYGYDALGNVTSIERRDVSTGRRVEGLVDENFGYDHQGHLIYHTDQHGDRVDYQYDALNRNVKETEPDVSFVSDALPNYDGLPKLREHQFNNLGFEDEAFEDGVAIEFKDFDELGRAQQIQKKISGTGTSDTKYELDPAGNVTRVTDSAGNVTTYEYDGLGRVRREGINVANSSSSTSTDFRTYDYDAAGNLKQFTDRDGRITTFTYDALGRKLIKTSKDPNDSTIGKVEFTYDSDGNLASAGSWTYDVNRPANDRFVQVSNYQYSNYDSRGRAGTVVETVSAFGASKTVTFTYDFDNRLYGAERQVDSARSGYTVTATGDGATYYTNAYQFDAAGREVFAEQDAEGDGDDKLIVHEYFASGGPTPSDNVTPFAAYRELVTRSSKVDGAFQVSLMTSTFYEKDDTYLIRRIEHLKADGTALTIGGKQVLYQYNYDVSDRLRRSIDRTNSDSNPITHYSDSVVTGSGMVSDYSQITTARAGKTTGIGYDMEGHVTRLTDDGIIDDDSYVLTWDADNRISKLVIGTSNTIYFYYDAFGNLVAQRNGSATDLLLFDGGVNTLKFVKSDSSSEASLVARSFYSASGELAALDKLAVGYFNTYWTLADKDGTIRELVQTAGATLLVAFAVNFADDGRLELPYGMPLEAVRSEGRQYVAAFEGFYDGKTWSSYFLDGRSLSVVAPAGQFLYGARDSNGVSGLSSWDSFLLGAAESMQLNSYMDVFQGVMSAGGVIPGFGAIFDLANTAIYFGRGKTADGWISLASAVPGFGDLFALGRGVKTAATIGITLRQVARATALSLASNYAEQRAKMAFGRQQEFEWEQSAGAMVSAMTLGFSTVGIGRWMEASKSPVLRAAVMGSGTGVSGALGDATTQFGAIASGRQDSYNALQGGIAFAGGAISGLAGNMAGVFDKTCFSGEMPMIARNDQGWKRADEVQANDYLASRDEHDPEAPVVWNRVEEVFVAQGEIWELEWNGRTIRTTAEHPFYVRELGWTPARELKPGQLLATMDGRYLPLTALVSTGKIETVYNFRIAQGHTYFVGMSEWAAALWAHNACVYESRDPKTGKVLYVGIADRGKTTTFPQRSQAADARTGIAGKKVPGTDGMTPKQVAAIEQALIAHHGRTIDGSGTLDNKYRGVYLSAANLRYGRALLKRIGYDGI